MPGRTTIVMPDSIANSAPGWQFAYHRASRHAYVLMQSIAPSAIHAHHAQITPRCAAVDTRNELRKHRNDGRSADGRWSMGDEPVSSRERTAGPSRHGKVQELSHSARRPLSGSINLQRCYLRCSQPRVGRTERPAEFVARLRAPGAGDPGSPGGNPRGPAPA